MPFCIVNGCVTFDGEQIFFPAIFLGFQFSSEDMFVMSIFNLLGGLHLVLLENQESIQGTVIQQDHGPRGPKMPISLLRYISYNCIHDFNKCCALKVCLIVRRNFNVVCRNTYKFFCNSDEMKFCILIMLYRGKAVCRELLTLLWSYIYVQCIHFFYMFTLNCKCHAQL